MALSGHIASGLATIAVAAGIGVAGTGGTTGASRTGAGGAPQQARARCSGAPTQLTQAMDGRISGCMRLGPLAPGPHTVVLQQLLDPSPPRSPRSGSPSEPAVAVSLSPASGRPGTVITVTARLRRPFGGRRAAHPDLCWSGCTHGLGYGGVSVRWISPRAFRARLTVPAAPWVMNGTFRLAPLVSGRYVIAVQCLRAAKGCAGITEGAAAFTLRGAHPPAWCRTQASCARLRVTPARALPGQVVRVSGFAPLSAVTGGGEPFVDEAATRRGRPRGSQVRFGVGNGVDQVVFGHAGLDVLSPPAYGELRDVTPIGEAVDGLTPITADPATPSVVAWCQRASIGISSNGATSAVPTTGAARVLVQMGFRRDPQPQCAAVAPIDSAAGTSVGLAAAFSVGLRTGIPPVYDAALATYDGGRTWAPVPVPSGSTAAAFGGFRYRGAALEAVFGALRPSKAAYPEIDALRPRGEVTSTDGLGWSAGPAGCPAVGPCVTFAPYAPGNCAMNGSEQPVVRSTDGGRRWSEPDFPPPVQACSEATLVALSSRELLLVNSTAEFPLLRSIDGGVSWRVVALPRGGRGNLTVLPDGSLLMTGGLQYTGRWKLLRPGRHAWCEPATPTRAVQRRFQASMPAVIDGGLWWLTSPSGGPAATPVVNRIPIAALRC